MVEGSGVGVLPDRLSACEIALKFHTSVTSGYLHVIEGLRIVVFEVQCAVVCDVELLTIGVSVSVKDMSTSLR